MTPATSPRERLEAFWAGQRPDRTPLTIYRMFTRTGRPEEWAPLLAKGLIPTDFRPPCRREHTGGVERAVDEYDEGGRHWRRTALRTPVGEVFSLHADGWQQKYMLATPEDYRVMTYVAEHTRVVPAYEDYRAHATAFAPAGVCMPAVGRTPIQTMLVDLAGLAAFSMHLYDFEDAVLTLHEALLDVCRRVVAIAAEGPGTMVEVLENFSVETLGPDRFARFHRPVYEELFGVLHQAGKIVATHFDGRLAACRELIADAPVDVIESLTPPPEGDMTLAGARQAWPEKLFWSNLNVGVWGLPPADLRGEVLRRAAEGSDDGRRLAFEISEDLPANWRQAIPVVLDALEETRRA